MTTVLNTTAWDELVRAHMSEVYRLAYRLTGDPHEAEDLTHDAFIRAFRAWDSFTPTNVPAWLHRITVNLYRDRYRRSKIVRFVPFDPIRHDGASAEVRRSGADHVLTHTWDDDVQAALMRLPLKFREAVLLCDVHEFTYDEIAEILGIKVGTVRSRIHRARALLRDDLRATRRPHLAPPTVLTAAATA